MKLHHGPLSEMQAFNLGCYAERWWRIWRFFVIQETHVTPRNGGDKDGKCWVFAYLTPKLQVEFFDGTAK